MTKLLEQLLEIKHSSLEQNVTPIVLDYYRIETQLVNIGMVDTHNTIIEILNIKYKQENDR